MIPLDYLLPIATFARKLISYSEANLNPMGTSLTQRRILHPFKDVWPVIKFCENCRRFLVTNYFSERKWS